MSQLARQTEVAGQDVLLIGRKTRWQIERPRSSRALHGVPIVSVNTDETRRRAETLFKKEQQLREAQQAMAEYQAELQATREKTARLRALRLARDAANQSTPSANQKGTARLGGTAQGPRASRASMAHTRPTRRPAGVRSAATQRPGSLNARRLKGA